MKQRLAERKRNRNNQS